MIVFMDFINDLFNDINKESLNEFKKLSNGATGEEGVKYLMVNCIKIQKIKDFISSSIITTGKEEETKINDSSDAYRLKGNKFYGLKQNENAFKMYTLAILSYVDDNSAENLFQKFKPILLAYSNRSAVFLDEKLYENCLKDIETIKSKLNIVNYDFTNNNNDEQFNQFIIKIINREIKCLKCMKQNDKIQNFINSISSLKIDGDLLDKVDDLKKSLCIDAQIIIPTNSIPIKNRINPKMSLQIDKQRGRHFIAKSDINIGECLIEENAYCAILLPEFCQKYCNKCLKLLIKPAGKESLSYFYNNITTCFKCKSVVYCSNDCYQRDQLSHSFECEIIEKILYNSGIAHLAYRIVTTTNYDILFKSFQWLTNNTSRLSNGKMIFFLLFIEIRLNN
jgi:hypothetical protein